MYFILDSTETFRSLDPRVFDLFKDWTADGHSTYDGKIARRKV